MKALRKNKERDTMKKMKNQFQRMTVAISLVLAGGVNAAVMSFTNPPPGDPGHVDWEAITNLNITKPASQQTGALGSLSNFGTFKFQISESFDVFTSTLESAGGIVTGFGGRIFREVQPGGNVGIGLLQPGDIVGPGGAIPQGGGG
jgi:hypothetical protein